LRIQIKVNEVSCKNKIILEYMFMESLRGKSKLKIKHIR